MSTFLDKENLDFAAAFDSLVGEKFLNREVLQDIIEDSIRQVVQEFFGSSFDLDVRVKKGSGSISVYKKLLVCSDGDDMTTISLDNAIKLEPSTKLGEHVFEHMPYVSFNQIMINEIRRKISERIAEKEKENEFKFFSDLRGKIVNGVVKKIYNQGLLVGIEKFEAYISSRDLIPGEFAILKPGSSLVAIVSDIKRDDKRHQATLSRTSDAFLVELMKWYVPEIESGLVKIVSIARDPGSRAKIAVHSDDDASDPVAICIGSRAAKVSQVMKEVRGERIDIIRWSRHVPEFLINSLKGIKVVDVMYDKNKPELNVILPLESISLAIGRDGQNARLVVKLLGNIPIHFMTDSDYSEKKMALFVEESKLLSEALGVEEIISQVLLMSGFRTVDDVANAGVSSIAKIEGFDEEIATTICAIAKQICDDKLQKRQKLLEKSKRELGDLKLALDFDIKILEEFVIVGLDSLQKIAEQTTDDIFEDFPEISLSRSVVDLVVDFAKEKFYG